LLLNLSPCHRAVGSRLYNFLLLNAHIRRMILCKNRRVYGH
jgi:hypothetical protein